jgi:hypothetical protein
LEEKSARLESCDELEFVGAIEEIDGILSRMHSPSSALMQAIDVKGQDYSTYYCAAYADTRDVDAALAAYDRVKNLVRIIVLMDRYFEVGNQRYRRLGKALMTRFRREADNNLKNILRFNMKQFWPFWKFENQTKTLMQQGHRFSVAEVRAFNLFKSSDAALLYAPVLEASLPNFNHNAALVIHYNQALQDIDDDLDDIQEDLRDQMPNIFILASLGSGQGKPYSHLYKHRLNGSRLSILENASGTVLEIVNEYEAMIAGIDLPEHFRFLKYLSRSYIGRIRKKLPIKVTQRQRLEVV